MPPTPHIRPNGLLSPSKLAHINNRVRSAWSLTGIPSQVKDVWETRPAWGVPPRDGDVQATVAKGDSRGQDSTTTRKDYEGIGAKPGIVTEKSRQLWATAPVEQPSKSVNTDPSSREERQQSSVSHDVVIPTPVMGRTKHEEALQRYTEDVTSVQPRHEESVSPTSSVSADSTVLDELSSITRSVQSSKKLIRKYYKYDTSTQDALHRESRKSTHAQQSTAERRHEESIDRTPQVSTSPTAPDETSNIIGGVQNLERSTRKYKNHTSRAKAASLQRKFGRLSSVQEAAAEIREAGSDGKRGSECFQWGQFNRAKELKAAHLLGDQVKNALDDAQKKNKKADTAAAGANTVEEGSVGWYADSPMEAIYSSAQETLKPAAENRYQQRVEKTSFPDDRKGADTSGMTIEARVATKAIPLDSEARAFCDQNNICYKCRKQGHRESECPYHPPEERRRRLERHINRDGTSGPLLPGTGANWRLGSVEESGTSFIRLGHSNSERKGSEMDSMLAVEPPKNATSVQDSIKSLNSKLKERRKTHRSAKGTLATEPRQVYTAPSVPSLGVMEESRGTDELAVNDPPDMEINFHAVTEATGDAEILHNKQALSDVTAELGRLRAQVTQMMSLMQNIVGIESSHLTNAHSSRPTETEDVSSEKRLSANKPNFELSNSTQIESRHAYIQSTIEGIRTAIETSQASVESLGKSRQSDRSQGIEELRTTIQDTTSARDSILEELFGEEHGGEDNASPEAERSTPPRLNFSPSEALQAPQSRPPRKLHPRQERMNRVSDIFNRLGREPTALHLTHASENLSTADFTRLIPTGKHIAEWAKTSIFRVIAGRDLYLRPKGQYYLIFPSPAEARAYQMNVARIHRLAKLHTQTSLTSPIAPPPGYLIDGENVHATMQSYALIPPSQPLHLNLVGPPRSANFQEMVRLGGYRQLLPDPAQKVILWVEGEDQPSHAGLRNFITQDGLDRGLSWGVEAQSITALQTNDVVEIDLGLGGNKEVKKKGVQRWVIKFEDKKMALRFWRRWHRRVWPMREKRGEEDGEESVVNVELIER